jgi:hypothetical protein
VGLAFSWFYTLHSRPTTQSDFKPQNQIKRFLMVYYLIFFAGMAFESFSVFGAKR